MSRLTKWVNGEVWYYTKEDHYPAREMDGYDALIAMTRLAHYEDLGFTPEEIALLAKFYKEYTSVPSITANMKLTANSIELEKYRKLKEQGRLAEVIRCKNCIRHSDEYEIGAVGISWCDEHERLTDDDDYCSYAIDKLAEMEDSNEI